MDSTEIQNYIQEADKVMAKVTPLLGVYGAPVQLGFDILAKSEPVIYAQILKWMDKGEPTEQDKTELRGLIAHLKDPDQYFS